MITRVKLINWKSHKETELTFSKGVNALIGIMGSGKTSVMQAITFALFGTFSLIQSKKLKIEDLIMVKPVESEEAVVEIDFIVNGNTYTVKRKIRRGKGTVEAEIRENGKLIQVEPKRVTEEVERILQMDYDLFSRAVYSEQNALDYFLQIPKGKRRDLIDNMLKLDVYEKVRENAVKLRRRVEERKVEKMKTIEDMKTRNIEERINEAKNYLKEKKAELNDLEKRKHELEEKLNEITKKIDEYEEKKERLNSLVRDIESLKSKMGEIDKYIKTGEEELKGVSIDKKSLEDFKLKVDELKNNIDAKESELKRIGEDISVLKGRLNFLIRQIGEYKKNIEEFDKRKKEIDSIKSVLGDNPEKRLEELRKSIDELKKKLYTYETMKNEIVKSLKELKEAGDTCPVCGSKLSDEKKKKLIEEREKNIKDLEDEIEKIKSDVKEKESTLSELEDKYNIYRDLLATMKDIDDIRSKINEYESEKNEVENNIQIKEKMFTEYESMLTKLREDFSLKIAEKERMESLLKKKEEIERLSKERNDILKEISLLEKERKLLESETGSIDIKFLRKEKDDIFGEVKKTEERIRSLNEMISEKKKVLEELERDMETLKRYKEDIERYNLITEYMDKFINAVKITQNQLRDEFLKTVNQVMNLVWPELYPYGDFEEIRLFVDNDYVLKLKTSRGWVNVEMVSGGERTIACLALRIAFSLAFAPNLKWLILDEPTHNMDRNAIKHFGEVLRDRMGNLVEQVFLITHEDILSDYITGEIYKFERDKDSDSPTKVIKLSNE